MTNPSPQGAHLRGLQILCGAMIVLVIVFAGIIVCLTQFVMHGKGDLAGYSDIILGIVAVTSVVCFIIARLSFAKMLNNIKTLTATTDEKINYYRTSLIRYMALCDFPALLAIMMLFTTADLRFTVIIAGMLIAMLLVFPTRPKLVAQIGLNWQEEQEL